MNAKIDAAIKRARGYWFADGFTEIAMGGLFLLLAGATLINRNTSQAPLAAWFASVTAEIIILKAVSFLIVVLILWWLKDHFTYPRTGFVRNQISLNQILVMLRNLLLLLLAPVILLASAALFVTSAGSLLASMPVWFPAALGLIWAVLIVLGGEWMGLLRFRLVGGTTLLAGVAVGIWQAAAAPPNFPSEAGTALLESIDRSLISLAFVLLIVGAAMLFSGVLTFLRYRKENPAPYSEDA